MRKKNLTKKMIFMGELCLLSLLTTFSSNSKKEKETRKSIALQYTQQPRDLKENGFSLCTDCSSLNTKKIYPEFLWTIEEPEEEKSVDFFCCFSKNIEKEMKKVENMGISIKEALPEMINWLEIEKKRSERTFTMTFQ